MSKMHYKRKCALQNASQEKYVQVSKIYLVIRISKRDIQSSADDLGLNVH